MDFIKMKSNKHWFRLRENLIYVQWNTISWYLQKNPIIIPVFNTIYLSGVGGSLKYRNVGIMKRDFLVGPLLYFVLSVYAPWNLEMSVLYRFDFLPSVKLLTNFTPNFKHRHFWNVGLSILYYIITWYVFLGR